MLNRKIIINKYLFGKNINIYYFKCIGNNYEIKKYKK